jgi:hypothetical protein
MCVVVLYVFCQLTACWPALYALHVLVTVDQVCASRDVCCIHLHMGMCGAAVQPLQAVVSGLSFHHSIIESHYDVTGSVYVPQV